MRSFLALILIPIAAALDQPPPVNSAFIRENYSKFEYRIAMRDGVKPFTSVYIPKDAFADGKTYPIMLQRTPYNVRPYGPDQFRENLEPSEFFAREKFIFAYQDIRGRFMIWDSFTLKVSTTGADSDLVVKVIDVFPNDYPDYNAAPIARASLMRSPSACPISTTPGAKGTGSW